MGFGTILKLNIMKLLVMSIGCALFFLKRGFQARCRGSLIVRVVTEENEDGHQTTWFNLVGGGTICEAMYLAAQLKPNNRFVKQVRDDGITNIIELATETPAKVRAWVKREHNLYSLAPD